MTYTATELAAPTGGSSTFARGPGNGYPTGDATRTTKYPNTPLDNTTSNPSGVANSPDEIPAVAYAPPGAPYAYAYSFKTWEGKAANTVPAGSFVTPITQTPLQPYP